MTGAHSNVLRIGLTGGIASGKTAAANLFADLGVPIIDTDLISRQLCEPGQPGLTALLEAFGSEIMHPDGTLNRAALRAIVFSNDELLERLNSLLHPLIRTATIAEADCTADSAAYQIIVVPLLIESDFDTLVDRVLVIDCPVDLQRQRLMARDGMDAAAAEAMIAAQASRELRLAAADDIIENNSDFTTLRAAVSAQHARYLELANAAT